MYKWMAYTSQNGSISIKLLSTITIGVSTCVVLYVFTFGGVDESVTNSQQALKEPYETNTQHHGLQKIFTKPTPSTRFSTTPRDINSRRNDTDLSDESDQETFSDLFEFMEYIDNVDQSDFELGRIIGFVEHSSDALDYLKSVYWRTNDPDVRLTMLYILDSSDNQDKYDIGMELASSQVVTERKMGYEWLRNSIPLDLPDVDQALINAFESETDSDLLVDLISLASVPDYSQDTHDRINRRVTNLTFHENERVATQAILALGQSNQGQDSLDAILFHLDSDSEVLQIASIKSLSKLDNPSETTIQRLNYLMSNPSLPQPVREAAVRTIVEFENNANAK